MTSSDKPSQISELLLDRLASDTEGWIEEGACVQASIDPFDPKNVRAMQALCDTCPVFDECSDYRDDKSVSSGVWGGVAVSKEEVKTK